jgi:hypothetical protein
MDCGSQYYDYLWSQWIIDKWWITIVFSQIWTFDSTSQCRLDASAHSASAPASADFGSLVLADSYQVSDLMYLLIWVSLWIENASWQMAVTTLNWLKQPFPPFAWTLSWSGLHLLYQVQPTAAQICTEYRTKECDMYMACHITNQEIKTVFKKISRYINIRNTYIPKEKGFQWFSNKKHQETNISGNRNSRTKNRIQEYQKRQYQTKQAQTNFIRRQ